jgi:hypothetical protein
VVVIAAILTATFVFLRSAKVERPVSEVDGIKQVSTVKDVHLAVYDEERWEARFWNGVNMGDTLPGHSPGELAPTREDYLRWFLQMKEMNVDVVRVYTILEPEFYEALEDFNSTREDPLWLMQGVWSPEEELIGEDEKGRDAYTPEITEEFRHEISDAVHVIHGDADLPERPGHASGRYRTDVSEYLLGWMIGTEWYPYAVKVTNDANSGKPPYSGEYFRATEDARPFESWLAWMLDTLAEEEMEYGWQHPASFTNWPTTDPLKHPNEANPKEDLVPVDPMHVIPTPAWRAGYFSQYHVYPYYPDFMRYDLKYQNYKTAEGDVDPYAGYLHELRAHHEGIPLMIGEFGLPTSRGMAHRGPLGRDQGYHTEEEQGRMVAGMLDAIRDEGFDGAFLFAWEDEWFKFTWNTFELELPGNRRQLWRNRLTNEENFGVIAAEAGERAEETIFTDGKTDDWDRRAGKTNGIVDLFEHLSERILGQDVGVKSREYENFDLTVSHDEAYLYLLFEKRRGEWDFSEKELDVGFGTLPGGSTTADPAPGLVFPGGGIQFLLRMRGEGDSRILVNSAYDQHTWLYADQLNMIPDPGTSQEASAGDFLPWNLALSREIVLPQTKERLPFEEIEVGVMRRGITDPSSEEFNNLADWYARGDVLEIRIPWMLLGFTDPSSLRVWDYPYEADALEPVKVEGVRVYPAVRLAGGTDQEEVEPLHYRWDGWNEPTFHERKKKSYAILREAFENKELR